MDNLNQAPFHVGQKVVCVNPAGFARLKKYAIYVVNKTHRCGCGNWLVDVGAEGGLVCSSCESLLRDCAMDARLFAPITEQYEDMTLSIAQSAKQTNEVPDKVLIPETINN